METIKVRHHYSRNILFRLILMSIFAIGLVVWKLDFVLDVYFRNQLTPTGILINGSIFGLFLLGMLKMIASFFGYTREESAVVEFVHNLHEGREDPTLDIDPRTMIAHRYRIMERLFENQTPINHGALAATLVASESTRNSLPKFVNNTLILTGVFGTIVSLSIALIGASDLLASAVEVTGMGLVVHGMSTALSTTITAIVCYLFFGYFYLKLTDVQTNLLSTVEQVTTNYLIPRFHIQPESFLYDFVGLVRSLQTLVGQMQQSQSHFERLEARLLSILDIYSEKAEAVSADILAIQRLLREGFRLPDDA